MKCKIFHAEDYQQLEDEVNRWLDNHEVGYVMYALASAPDYYTLQHVLVMFYMPRVDEEATHA